MRAGPGPCPRPRGSSPMRAEPTPILFAIAAFPVRAGRSLSSSPRVLLPVQSGPSLLPRASSLMWAMPSPSPACSSSFLALPPARWQQLPPLRCRCPLPGATAPTLRGCPDRAGRGRLAGQNRLCLSLTHYHPKFGASAADWLGKTARCCDRGVSCMPCGPRCVGGRCGIPVLAVWQACWWRELALPACH